MSNYQCLCLLTLLVRDVNLGFRAAGAVDGVDEAMGQTRGCEPHVERHQALYYRLPPGQSRGTETCFV